MSKTDPLQNVPDPQRVLFDKFCQLSTGFPVDQVIGAAVNILINGLRQAHPTQVKALASFDESMARARALIASHYDQMGKRRNVFPFHQTIEVPLNDMRPKGRK